MMRWQVLAVWVLLALGAGAWAQSAPLATGPNGVAVTAADLAEGIDPRAPPEARATMLKDPANVAQLARGIAVRRVLVAQAEDAQLDKDPQIALQLKLARERVLADAQLAKLAGAPTDAAVLDKLALAEYRANPDKYSTPEKLRVRHILIDARSCDAEKRIESLLQQLKDGADFAKLATEFSQDPGSGPKGGDLGFFSRGKMDPEFEKAAFALAKPGDLSGIVRTQFGLHILKLEERTPGTQEPFEKVRDAIVKDLAARESQRRREEAVDALAAKLTVDPAAIDAFVGQHR